MTHVVISAWGRRSDTASAYLFARDASNNNNNVSSYFAECLNLPGRVINNRECYAVELRKRFDAVATLISYIAVFFRGLNDPH